MMLTTGFWKKRRVSLEEWKRENLKNGSVYFAKDVARDMVKIGHSFTPFDRVNVLQIGSAAPLKIIGVMAAPRSFETQMHHAFTEGHAHGEWFYDRDMISLFLHDVTGNEQICATAWDLVPGRGFIQEWDETTKSHKSKRYFDFDPGAASWEMGIR